MYPNLCGFFGSATKQVLASLRALKTGDEAQREVDLLGSAIQRGAARNLCRRAAEGRGTGGEVM